MPEGSEGTGAACEIPPSGEECACKKDCPGNGNQCLDDPQQVDCGESPESQPDGYVMHCDLPCICFPVVELVPICPDSECPAYPEEALAALDCALRALRDRVRGKIRWTRLFGNSIEHGTIYLYGEEAAASHACVKHPDGVLFSPPTQGKLKSFEHFKTCISNPIESDRFKCLYEAFEIEAPMPDCGCARP